MFPAPNPFAEEDSRDVASVGYRYVISYLQEF